MAAQPHAREPAFTARDSLLARDAAKLEANHDVVERRAPGQQRLALEQVASPAVQALERLAADSDLARRGGEQAGGNVQQRGLAAASRTDYRDEFAGPDRQRGVANRRIARRAFGDEGNGDPFQR
jgi:hypothetical protein